MIIIGNTPADINELSGQYPANGIEAAILKIMNDSASNYTFSSKELLDFELKLRKEIVAASYELYKSGLDFAIFRKSRCNPKYWERTPQGGFLLKSDVKPSDAINDIFNNGSRYGTECATAMVMIYYKALLNLLGEEKFNRLFPKIHLMNWHYIDPNLREIGSMRKADDFLPGDRLYFANPDVDPATPEWQGENVIDLSNGLYYGHGVGVHRAEGIIRALNRNRARGADETAYLMDSAARPNFKNLYRLSGES